ncbi:hypothetical protein Leryth_008985 [Lithospermum erythrorhizon]|nr:hypothetical protein Leryth_008985 [Lithospermum erythrorhizon]
MEKFPASVHCKEEWDLCKLLHVSWWNKLWEDDICICENKLL